MTNNRAESQGLPEASPQVTAARKRLNLLYSQKYAKTGGYRGLAQEIGSSNWIHPYMFMKFGKLPANFRERWILLHWRPGNAEAPSAQPWTEHSSAEERAILELVQPHQGETQAIHGEELHAQLQARGLELDERQMRDAIKQLRRQGKLICAKPGVKGGYFMATSMTEFEGFDQEEFSAKIADMEQTRQAMRKAARQQFGPITPEGQMELPRGDL